MKRNTTTELLCVLTESEMRKLAKFLNSPYFNNSKPIAALFNCIRKWHPDYDEDLIQPATFWKSVQPDEAFTQQKYWKLNFKLRTLVEQFMAVEELQGNEFAYKKQVLKSYGRRNAHALFEKATKELVEQVEGQQGQEISSYSKLLWLKYDYFFHLLTDKYSDKAIYDIENVMGDLDRFYVLAKLRFASEVMNRDLMLAQHFEIRLLKEAVAESYLFEKENPAFLLYRTMLGLHDPEKADKAFGEGKAYMEKHGTGLSKTVQNLVMLNLTNHAIRQLNIGKAHYNREMLDLYKISLRLGLIIENNNINDVTFFNIVNIGCSEKDLEWTMDFIETHQKYLEEDIREDLVMMALAKVSFEKKEFDKALNLIENREFDNAMLNGNAKIFTVKIWFEKFLKDKDLYFLLSHKLATDEKYFRRNDVFSEQRKSMHINFVLALKYLTNLIMENNSIHEINQKMEDYLKGKTIVAKKWLHDKTMQPYKS